MNYMDLALDEAKRALKLGEVPVGAIIVHEGEIIAKAYNMKETLKDVTAHAEILAIREASRKIGNWRLSRAQMYVTLEPCPMCASAIAQARIETVYIGTFDPTSGACGSLIDLAQNNRLNTFYDVKWCYDERCSEILTNFFEQRRKENRGKNV
ncbi:nucleoside deaminase [uncultured Clostridium sp.]|jgi:tRNA(adenine34) deaminase|uniref:nucleoside deaminase n=1 Tax=uncultured Clostridium sp. TaxID=59620 RepID=UPI00260A18B9|nr:nucleoside deaminase [uncultured Clostridium sp.]